MTTAMARLAQVLAITSVAAASLAASLPWAGAAQAQGALSPAKSDAPIDVTSDALELIDAQHLAIYKGNVEVVQNGDRLVCDILNVYFSGKPAGTPAAKPAAAAPGAPAGMSDWGEVQKLVADGHVFYVTSAQTARGEHAIYDLTPDTITMTGDVVVVQGANVVKGDKLIIQVKTGHTDIVSNATGRNKPDRVRSVLYNDNPSPAAGASAAPAKPAK